jgi:NAD(P)-dependent dehydrogenase (short-subunit alcohol dehydrogenase family)
MSQFLKDKVALVTGGGRPLGAAITRALAQEGATVAITLNGTDAKIAAATQALAKGGIRGRAFRFDPGDSTQAIPLIRAVLEEFGTLDILVNASAVMWHGKTVDDSSLNSVTMDRQWQLNVLGVIGLIRAASPHIRPGGRIITMGTGLAMRAGFTGVADYVGTKAAITGYTMGLARDLAARCITANMVAAGMAEDEYLTDAKTAIDPNQRNARATRKAVSLDEVAAGILYLAHPMASSVTGTTLDLSGGYLA